MKKPFDEIMQLFEHKSYLIRSEFINDYDFDDDYNEYYRQFILNAKRIRNHLYLSDLIDLSGWLDIYDEALQVQWFSYLFKPAHYVVKLAVLDYFKFCKKKKADLSYEKKLKGLLKKRLLQIVRAQVLFNLISLNTNESKEFIDDLNALLTGTNDERIFYRVLNNLIEVGINKKYKQAICRQLTIIGKEGKLNKELLQVLKGVEC